MNAVPAVRPGLDDRGAATDVVLMSMLMPMLALLLLFLGVSILSLQDSTVKLIAPQTSFWQVQVVRSAFNLVMVCGLAVLAGGLGLLWPRRF